MAEQATPPATAPEQRPQKPYYPLRSESAYVVQLGGPLGEAGLYGRVEHVVSGNTCWFHSAEDLVGFLQTPPAPREPASKDTPTLGRTPNP